MMNVLLYYGSITAKDKNLYRIKTLSTKDIKKSSLRIIDITIKEWRSYYERDANI
jgi:hypothetical protein